MAARRKEAADPPMDCVYGCGRPADGILMVTFLDRRPPDRRNSGSALGELSCHLPACRRCVRGAVTVRVAIPEGSSS